MIINSDNKSSYDYNNYNYKIDLIIIVGICNNRCSNNNNNYDNINND
jgi:hypothetical protein